MKLYGWTSLVYKYYFYTGIISGIDTSYKICKLVTGLVSITVSKHCIVSMIIHTKYNEKTFYLLYFFHLGCMEHHDGPLYVFAVIGPFPSWYNNTESGDVLYPNSSILFFNSYSGSLLYPISSLNSSIQYHVWQDIL